MPAIVLVLALLASTCHGRRHQMRSKTTQETSFDERQSSRKAVDALQRHALLSEWKTSQKAWSQAYAQADEGNTLKTLAMFLQTLSTPAAAWQVGGPSMRSVRARQLQSRPLPQQLQAPIWSTAQVRHRSRCSTPVASAEDAAPPPEDGEPNLDVRWLNIDMTKADAQPREGAMTIPVFPLGGAYTPYTQQTLTIFEPRYRKMYDDILFSGARRFAVPAYDSDNNQIAETAVIFYLDDLQEISGKTNDMYKYVGEHSIPGRVKLKRVLNPKSWMTRDTYLRAEAEIVEDTDADIDTSDAEEDLKKRFVALIDAQTKLDEKPRFSDQVKTFLNFTRETSDEDTGLWSMVNLWRGLLDQRRQSLQNTFQTELNQLVMEYVKANDIPSSGRIDINDLPAALQESIESIKRDFQAKVEENDQSEELQAMLQTTKHSERLSLLRYRIDEERKRYAAKIALKNMFEDK